MASQGNEQMLPRLVNERLAWDGVTQDWNGVPVERPVGWDVVQRNASSKDTTLAVFHRSQGVGIDAGYKTGSVTLVQTEVRFPAGTYALRVDLFNHAQPAGPYDANWQVAVISPHSAVVSDEWWITREKGERSLYAVVRVVQGFVGALELRYTVRYASVSGEMQVRRVTFTDRVPATPEFRLVVGAGVDHESGVDGTTDNGAGVALTEAEVSEVAQVLDEIDALQEKVRSLLKVQSNV